MTSAERVYTLTMMDGAPHFHTWLVPRAADAFMTGVAYLAADHSCTEQEALTENRALAVASRQPFRGCGETQGGT